MSDTPRSLADLLALFADNTTKEVSPQKVRDALVSILGGFGGIYVVGGSYAQAINIAPAKVTGTATGWSGSFPSYSTTPSPTNSRITVAVAGIYFVAFHFCGLFAANKLFTLKAYVNAAAVAGIEGVVNESGATDVHHAFAMGFATCAANDQVSVFAQCEADAQDMTVAEAQLVAIRVQ